jgi:hypothetical protein
VAFPPWHQPMHAQWFCSISSWQAWINNMQLFDPRMNRELLSRSPCVINQTSLLSSAKKLAITFYCVLTLYSVSSWLPVFDMMWWDVHPLHDAVGVTFQKLVSSFPICWGYGYFVCSPISLQPAKDWVLPPNLTFGCCCCCLIFRVMHTLL